MALYKYVAADNSIVQNTATGAMIPAAVGQGGWQGDAYRAWLAVGNTPDAYVAPVIPASTPAPVTPPSYTIATLPAVASVQPGAVVYVTDLKDGAANCYADPTSNPSPCWRRVGDNSVVN